MSHYRWARFERFALDGPDSKWMEALFWPQFLAAMTYLIAKPIREWWLERAREEREGE